MDLSGKRVVVVGLGASGVAAARLCLRRGAHVTATDTKLAELLDVEARSLGREGARLVLGGHDDAGLGEADLVVVSPGVPPFAALVEAERSGVPVVGEVALAIESLTYRAPLVYVGGTNGKSTTTSLIGAMLERQGMKTFTGGNLGEPLANHDRERFDAIVLEVSSFQVERLPVPRADVSVLLNVTDDHLDRYPSFDAYAAAKGNTFVSQTSRDTAVVPAGDAVCEREARRGAAARLTFGEGAIVDVTPEAIFDRRTGDTFRRRDVALAGGHNALNVAAAIAAVGPLGVGASAIRDVLSTFRGLPHRMVRLGEVAGVSFYDDSKGTNVGAAVTALLGVLEARAVLIAGGRDKGGSYAPLVSALRQKGRAAVLLGEAASALAEAIGDAVPVERADSMRQAVRASARLARPGDAVLLSPACSSYDMFRDYKHRGDVFAAEVRALAESPS